MPAQIFSKQDIAEWNLRLTHLGTQETTEKEHIEKLKEARESEYRKLISIEEQIKPYDLKINAIIATFNFFRVEGEINSLITENADIDLKLSAFAPALRGLKKAYDEADQKVIIQNDLIKIKKLITSIEELTLLIATKEKDWKSLQSELSKPQANLIILEQEITSLEGWIIAEEKLRAQVERDAKASLTPKELEKRINPLRDRLTTLKATYAQNEKTLKTINEKILELKDFIYLKDLALIDYQTQLDVYLQEHICIAQDQSLGTLLKQLKQVEKNKKIAFKKYQETQVLYDKLGIGKLQLGDKLTTLKAQLEDLKNQAGQYIRGNLEDLKKELVVLERNKAPLAAESQKISQKIHEIEVKLHKSREYLQQITAERVRLGSDHFKFLHALKNDPQLLLNQFITLIKTSFTDYDFENPASQNLMTRICLLDFASHVRFIELPQVRLNEAELKQMSVFTQAQIENKFYQLCGLLYSMLVRLNFPCIESKLGKLIQSFFNEEFFHKAELQKEECIRAYRELCKIHSIGMKETLPEELPALEYAYYDQTKSELKSLIDELQNSIEESPEDSMMNTPYRKNVYKKFYSKADSVLHAVQSYENHPQFDVKYHATLLKYTREILKNPQDRHISNRYRFLAQHDQYGKPSTSKKVVGASMMFLGLAVMICSFIILPTPFNWIGFGGGMALTVTGLGLFKSGKPKNLSMKISELSDAAENIPISPLLDFENKEDLSPNESRTSYLLMN